MARGSIGVAFRALTSVRVEGLEHLPASGPFVLAVNHLSMMDVPLALVVLPRPAVMLAADYLQRSRWLDWFIGELGHAIYVERGAGDRAALDRAIEVLRAGGVLALAPEGTRSQTGALGPGHPGAAYLATETGAPVVPLVAWGQERLGRFWKRFRRAPIHVRIGAPLHLPKGTASAAQLREHTDRVMHALAAELPPEYRGVYAI
jgi:1-acyl-sn-glycerol-3-phosphate acyltransferase